MFSFQGRLPNPLKPPQPRGRGQPGSPNREAGNLHNPDAQTCKKDASRNLWGTQPYMNQKNISGLLA